MSVHAHVRCTPAHSSFRVGNLRYFIYKGSLIFSYWPIILYLSTRGRRSGASLAHPLVLHNGRRRRPAPPSGGHLGQGPLLLPPAPGHQEEPAIGGLSQLLTVLPVRELVNQYGHPRGGAGSDREAGQPRPTPHPLLRDKPLTKPFENILPPPPPPRWQFVRSLRSGVESGGQGLAKTLPFPFLVLLSQEP